MIVFRNNLPIAGVFVDTDKYEKYGIYKGGFYPLLGTVRETAKETGRAYDKVLIVGPNGRAFNVFLSDIRFHITNNQEKHIVSLQ